MKRLYLAVFGALALAPLAGTAVLAQSADPAKCATVTVSKATAKDLGALLRDAACSAQLAQSAVTSQKTRLDKAAALAATPTPAPAPAGKPVVVAEGDSISLLWSGSYTGLFASSHSALDVRGMAVAGARITDPTDGNGLDQRLPKVLLAKPAVVTVLIGANDLGDGTYVSAQAWLDALWSYIAKVKASGAKVAVGTVLPICLPAYADYTKRTNERRAIVNPAIRAAVGTRIDAVIDFAAEPTIGVDAAACGKAFKDGIHPSDDLQPRMAAIYAAAVDRLLAGPVADTGAVPAAIPSNFDRAAFITGGQPIPSSAAPDVVGAFRFICQPGQILRDDPIVNWNQPGQAHALHQFFGNLSADAYSTFATLRTKGDSTCMNPLNRSAYWMPAMLNAAGMVIRPDFISIYYKRLPASSPECARRAAKGCGGLPNGLSLIAGFDHAVSGPQPAQNLVFHWRCVANQIHRDNLADTLADCGGAGQVIATVNFGSCWSGKTDSADHRSHVVPFIRDQNSGLEMCPKGYDRIIPELTQSMAWTVTKEDGAVRLSSDHDGDKPGSTLHADYKTAWDQPTLDTAMANCIDKLLNCSDGDLGNGTIMKRRAGFTYTASPRVVAKPR